MRSSHGQRELPVAGARAVRIVGPEQGSGAGHWSGVPQVLRRHQGAVGTAPHSGNNTHSLHITVSTN